MSSNDKDKEKKKDKKEKDKSKDKDKDKDKSKDKDKEKDKSKDKSIDEKTKKIKSSKGNIIKTPEVNNNDIDGLSLLSNDINTNTEKCNGCFIQTAVVYCTNCQKLYCKMCEDQIHIVPRLKSHERVTTNMVYALKKICYNHNLKLDLYCETCEEPICNDCYELGPHNTRLHRVVLLSEAFRTRYDSLRKIVKTHLRPKYDIFIDQVNFLEFNIEEIKNERDQIERTIHQEYISMIDKIKSQEGKKMAYLNYDSAIIQKDISSIHDINNFVDDFSMSKQPDMIDFLIKFKMISESVNDMLNRPIKTDVTINSDFICELDERRKKLSQYDKALEVLKNKDDIIWSLIQEQKIEEEKAYALVKEKARNEISDWKKLSEKYSSQLESYIMVCYFCGSFLEEETMNNQCPFNQQNTFKDKTSFSNEQVPLEAIGNRRHYFGKPTNDYYDKINNLISKTHLNQRQNDERVHLEEQQLELIKEETENKRRDIKKEREKEDNIDKERLKTNDTGKVSIINYDEYYNKNTNLDLAGIYDKIKYYAGKQGIEFEAFINKFFNGKTQTSYDDLKLLLATKFELSEKECNRFLGQVVSDPPQIGNKNIYSGQFNETCRDKQEKDVFSSLSSKNNSPFNTQRNFFNNNIVNNNDELVNRKIYVEDFLKLLKRSQDIPKDKNQKEQNEFQKEREMLSLFNSKKEASLLNKTSKINDQANQLFTSDNSKSNQQPKSSFIRDVIIKIVTNIRLLNINFYQLLSEEDQGDGNIRKDILLSILSSKFNLLLSVNDLNCILSYLNVDTKMIDIQKFLIKLMDSYDNFTKQQN